MTIDMKSLAREGAKARLWQLETEKKELLRAFPDLCVTAIAFQRPRKTALVAGVDR